MGFSQATTMIEQLYAADARFIQAARAYAARTALEGSERDDQEWPEGIQIDSLSDERAALEEQADESGDPEAMAFVRYRRQRDLIE